MSTKLVLKVDKSGQRLDLFIVLNTNLYSRTNIKTLINAGKVLVNSEVQYRPHYKVKEGDEIVVEGEGVRANVDYIVPRNIPLNILYEDKDLLIVDKPTGLVTHPATGHQEDTLMNGVLYHYQQLLEVGDKKRSGLIHRLDKDTSGLILVGKTNLGLWYYSKLFAEKKIEKTYLVVVRGNILPKFPNKKLIIKTMHGRNIQNRKKFSSQKPAFGKLAETHFEFLNYFEQEGEKYSVLAAHPLTGRTHQIRVHLSELGYPVLGDQIYGQNPYKRLMLHAWKLKLKLINSDERTFIAPIPADFKAFMNADK